MPTIFEAVNANEISTFITTVPPETTEPYWGETLFPNDRVVGLDLSWFKDSMGLPVALKPAQFDTKAPLRDRVGFSKIESEMPFFRESFLIGEKERQQILQLMASGNQQVMIILRRIYQDAMNLVKGARVQAERMRMQLIANGGTINVSANGLPYTYDWGFNATHKTTLAGTRKWTDYDNADIYDDIKTGQNKIAEDTGTRPTRLMVSAKTWGYMLKNKKIRLDLDPIGGTNSYMTDAKLKEWLLTRLGITEVMINEQRYKLEVGGGSYAFFPDDVAVLLPAGPLGNTYHGTTPEEADLLNNQVGSGGAVEVSVLPDGVAITTIQKPHPVNVETLVSDICLPSFEGMDTIYIMIVHS